MERSSENTHVGLQHSQWNGCDFTMKRLWFNSETVVISQWNGCDFTPPTRTQVSEQEYNNDLTASDRRPSASYYSNTPQTFWHIPKISQNFVEETDNLYCNAMSSMKTALGILLIAHDLENNSSVQGYKHFSSDFIITCILPSIQCSDA